MPRRKIRRADCIGCRDEVYHGALGGPGGCWEFDSAQMILRRQVHINDRPPWTAPFRLRPSCYRKSQHVFQNKEAPTDA